jgi:hypothetical protein
VGVIAQPVGVQEVLRPVQLGGPQHLRAGDALIAEVVHRVTDPLVRHRMPVLLTQQHRDQAGVPVVAMDDIRALAGLQQELQRRLGKEREPCNVVVISVQQVPAEEVIRRVRLDEKALPAVHEPEPHGAVHRPAVPWHPQVMIDGLQAPDIALPHAGVHREDDLHRVPPDLQLTAQAEYHTPSPPAFATGAHSGATITMYTTHLRRQNPGNLGRGPAFSRLRHPGGHHSASSTAAPALLPGPAPAPGSTNRYHYGPRPPAAQDPACGQEGAGDPSAAWAGPPGA